MEYTNSVDLNRDTAVTIGNFDGLHLGHRMLIHKVKEYADQYKIASVAFSFSPHPATVLGHKPFYAILSPLEKRLLLKEAGLDVFLDYPFNADFSQIDPEHFMEMLFDRLRCKVLVVGEGYRFGKGRAGTAELMRQMGERRGIKVEIVPHVYDEEESIKISSSRIRELILQGHMEKVESLLGRPYFIIGEVLNGRKIGRTLGFPTVNLIPPPLKILPPNGVYATMTSYPALLSVLEDGFQRPGVTNVGRNPTVQEDLDLALEDGCKTVETYIFDFDRDIYGEQINVCFYEKLRDEIKFNSVDELKSQIARDAQAVRKRMEPYSSPNIPTR